MTKLGDLVAAATYKSNDHGDTCVCRGCRDDWQARREATAKLKAPAMAALLDQARAALEKATILHHRRPSDITGPRGAGEPDDCLCVLCAVLAAIEAFEAEL